MGKIASQVLILNFGIILFLLPVNADFILPEKARVKDMQSLLFYLDRAFSENPILALPYIRALADSDYPEKLVVLQTYYDLATGFSNSKLGLFADPQIRAQTKQELNIILDILEVNIRLVEAEQQPPEVARRIYIEMVNDESRSLFYRAEPLRRLEDEPPREIAKSLLAFLPDWEEKPGGRQYQWKVHPAITIRAVRMMKKVCGKEIVPLLDNWLREFQATNSIWAELRDVLVDTYWDLRFAGLSVEEKIKIAIDELFQWKGHGLMPREAFIKIGKDAVPTLISLLYVPNTRVSGSADWALARIKDERAIDHLIKILDDPVLSPTVMIRVGRIRAIAQIGGSKAILILKQLLKRINEHPFVISEALNGLRLIGNKSVEKDILPFLTHPEKIVRYSAANALKTCGTQKAVPFLLQCFETETDHAVKVAIAHALKALGISVEVKPMPLNEK